MPDLLHLRKRDVIDVQGTKVEPDPDDDGQARSISGKCQGDGHTGMPCPWNDLLDEIIETLVPLVSSKNQQFSESVLQCDVFDRSLVGISFDMMKTEANILLMHLSLF